MKPHHIMTWCNRAWSTSSTEERGRSAGSWVGPSGARFRTYERLKAHAERRARLEHVRRPSLLKAIDDIYRYPLRQMATDTLNRQLRAGISDEELAELVIALREEDRLCVSVRGRRAASPRAADHLFAGV